MTYAALLRGINVGGNNKVEMKRLKESFRLAGMEKVESYINSENIVFSAEGKTRQELSELLEQAVQRDFDRRIPVLVRSLADLDAVMEKLPENWKDGPEQKCDVLFLWDEIDQESLLEELEVKPGIDTVCYVPGAVLWAVRREHLTKSGLMKLAGKSVYQKMTVRNVNTVRKIHQILQRVSQSTR